MLTGRETELLACREQGYLYKMMTVRARRKKRMRVGHFPGLALCRDLRPAL